MEDNGIELSEAQKALYRATAQRLKGHERRMFMARVVKLLGKGGQSQAKRELGWARATIGKGTHALDRGLAGLDNYGARGRQRAEEHWPNLRAAIRDMVDGQSQTDPRFKRTRLDTRLSAAAVRQALITRKGYPDSELPSEETIQVKLNTLGYTLRRVKKRVPPKIKGTDAIFEHLAQIHSQARTEPSVWRVALDAKAAVAIGPSSRHGTSRVHVQAADHDFKPDEVLTPSGIFLPEQAETYRYRTPAKLTADFMVDCLRAFWQTVQPRFPLVKTVLLNLDNGPENHSRRTQFMARLTQLAAAFGLPIQLAYDLRLITAHTTPLSASGVFSNSTVSGTLLDSRQTVLRLASTMPYNGLSPIIRFVETLYQTAVRLSACAMAALDQRFERLPGLEPWFVRIVPRRC